MYVQEKIQKYIESHTTPESDVLSQLNRETNLKVLNPRMISGNYQGRFLSLISQLVSPLYVLEIGTFTGYSAICLANGLRKGGKVITIDINDELEDIVYRYIEKSKNKDKIEYLKGNALEIIPQLNYIFDIVFIDAEKREYNEYFDLINNKIKIGGLLIVDNVLWNGKVVESNSEKDPSTLSITKFNQQLFSNENYEVIILPIRDGISMARKIK